jgi:hypothetical protein
MVLAYSRLAMARVTLWLLAVLLIAGGNYYAHLQAQQPRQYPCPPECSDCGHSWASSTPVCTPKNMKGMK